MTPTVDFLAQDIDVYVTNDRRSVMVTFVIGKPTCSVSLPRERVEKLGDRITLAPTEA